MTRQVSRTDDGRWLVVDGRRWRAADPALPDDVRARPAQEAALRGRLVRRPAHPRVCALCECGAREAERVRREEDEAAQRTRVGGGEREEARVVRARGSEEWVEPGEVGDGEVVLDGHDWKLI